MTLYYVRLIGQTEKAYLFLAATERDAEEYADNLRGCFAGLESDELAQAV
jgi:hypothetical protein